MGKRGATVPASPMKKKLKKNDPLVVNLSTVEGALYDSGVEVPGTKANRKMLIEALPRALGDGAAVDERHAYQTVVVDAIREVFAADVNKWTEKVAAAQAELDVVNSDKAGKDAVLAEKTATLDAKKEDIQQKKDKHLENKTAQKDAEKALVDATAEVENFDDNVKKTEETKVKYETAVNVTLAALVKGEYENAKEKKAAEGKGIDTLRALLGESGADDSLVSCFHAALHKKSEDRGSFDTTVIGEVEKRLNSKIAAFASELAEGPAAKEKKQGVATAAATTKDAAIATQEASAEVLKAAEAEKPDLDAAVKSAAAEVKEVDKVQAGKLKKLATEQAGLDGATANQAAWKFLAERPAAAPEPEEPEVPAEGEAEAAAENA